MNSTLVSCRGLICRLGGQLVLNGTDMDIAEGESVAFLGRSGSGKSTLLRVIAGLEVPERGEVLIAGQPATTGGHLVRPPFRRGVAMLFQDLALWPNLTVTGNLRLGLSGLRLSREELHSRIDEAMKLCGIEELADRRPGTLSGGQQQRVALARALVMQPKLLLLDEPFGGLDLLTKETIIHEIGMLKSSLGFSLVLVTHDPFEVRNLCNSLAVLEDGRIADRGSFNEIAANAKSALATAFIKQLSDTKSIARG